jgi:hypothetical protein
MTQTKSWDKCCDFLVFSQKQLEKNGDLYSEHGYLCRQNNHNIVFKKMANCLAQNWYKSKLVTKTYLGPGLISAI